MINVKKLYDNRFNSLERVRKNELWKVLCHDFLQIYIKKNDSVVDLGAGNCEFINNIQASKKYAVDINKDLKNKAARNIIVKIAPIKYLKKLFPVQSIDVIFMSNLLEHLDNKEEVFRLLRESFTILKKGGRLLIMQPDIALAGGQYWDFFDHKVPITYRSLSEVLVAVGFKITDHRYPFLPYSTKLKYVPLNPLLLKLYIKLRFLHFIFGRQFFVCASKK